MAEKLYTIPVNDAFSSGAECPVCFLYNQLEENAVAFMMGPSYMEDDVRMETNEKGFCKAHMKLLLDAKNRLGLALILKTHLDRQAEIASVLKTKTIKPKSILKKQDVSEAGAWGQWGTERCYLCDRINALYPLYLQTVLALYKKDEAFREKYRSCKGFCQAHAGELIERAREVMNAKELKEFADTTFDLYIENAKRLSEDLDWFANKFDYRYKDAPWKNAKDSVERAVMKTNGIDALKNNAECDRSPVQNKENQDSKQ